MQNLLAFMNAVRDNGAFVSIVAVLVIGFCVVFITGSVQYSIRRAQKIQAEKEIEQKRIDSARSVVPVQKRMRDVES